MNALNWIAIALNVLVIGLNVVRLVKGFRDNKPNDVQFALIWIGVCGLALGLIVS